MQYAVVEYYNVKFYIIFKRDEDISKFWYLSNRIEAGEKLYMRDEALVITYAEKGITHDNQSLENPDKPGQYKDMPILGDLYEVLLRKRECRRMANILNRLVHGSASTFNQKTNVDLSNKYVVLDISELSGDLLLGMFVALDFVWAKAKEDRTVESRRTLCACFV